MDTTLRRLRDERTITGFERREHVGGAGAPESEIHIVFAAFVSADARAHAIEELIVAAVADGLRVAITAEPPAGGAGAARGVHVERPPPAARDEDETPPAPRSWWRRLLGRARRS
jgi:hypothetical protein